MKVLIIGGGGREHAIAQKIYESPLLTKLYCAPGNPGTAEVAQNLEIGVREFSAIADAIEREGIEMVIVGPEEPLVRGLKEYLLEQERFATLKFVGPDSRGAQLEGSKSFAKDFMERHSIPTARYRSFTSNQLKEAISFLKEMEAPYVLKADGLAAGKGVIIAESLEEAEKELREMLDGKFGEASQTVVIEQFLTGIELSLFIITDGENYLLLPEAKDYKRIGEGETGPNTGGMGAVSPVPFATPELIKKSIERVVEPTLKGLKEDGINFSGFIFFGLINCNSDPYVIEYNVRLGDPETEAIMPRIESDLLAHLIALTEDKLRKEEVKISPKSAITVVLASGGYPGDFEKGFPITIGQLPETTTLYHSGTKFKEEEVVTSGGRLLAVTELGESIEKCREKLYNSIDKINYQGKSFRRDIGEDLLD